ncbi:MAG: hypothetical protein ACLS8T_35850 [Anaerobutyricum sp.]
MKLGKTKLKRMLSEETGFRRRILRILGSMSITEIKSSCRSVVIRYGS